MRADGTFIAVEVDDAVTGDRELALKLTDACPWTSSPLGDSGVEIVEQNLDECVFCRLCLDASPDGAVRVIKLYDNDAVLV